MIRKTTIALGALALAACGGPATKEEAMADAANYFNRYGTDALAGQFKGIKVKSSVQEDVLVIRMENFPSGTRTFDPDAVRKLFRPKMCEMSSSREIIDMGGKIRVEIQSNYGKELPSVTVARC